MSQLSDPVYRRLFQASPGKLLVVRPRSFEIVAVTAAYLQATMTRESDIIGKTLFEAFPDDPDDPKAEGTSNLLASLERVQSLKTADIVGILRYPVRRPDGEFEERFWSPVNSPVLNDAGELEFIIHRVEDVTAIVQGNDGLHASPPDDKQDLLQFQDVILRSRELRQALSKQQEYEARMRTAEQLLRLAGEKAQLGGWRVELDSETIIWTAGTAAIHEMPASYSPASVTEAVQFYAPEHREIIQEVFNRCARLGVGFDVVCQLQTPEGRHPWVRSIGIAERDRQGRVKAVQGAFQDISKLRAAQERADEADRQRLDVLESISDAFFTLDEAWNFTFANQQTGILMERSRDELLGRNLWEEFPQTVGSEFEHQYQLAVESRQTARFQAHYSPLGKWFDVNAYPIPTGLAVYVRDITREHKHQEQLRLVEAALSRQNDIVMITTADPLDEPDGPCIVYVNDAFERLTGFSRSEAIGRTPRLLQGPKTDRQQRNRIREALRQKAPIRCEVLNYKKTGELYWVELDITPLLDDEARCTHFVAVERDITARKQQESELQVAQERFQLISRATNDVIRDWNLTTDEIWWNDSMTDVFGYELTELDPGSSSWADHIHADDVDRVVRSIHEVINGENEYWDCEYRFVRKDGRSANVIDRGFVIRDQSGRAVRMAGSMLDITDRMVLEQQLRESQKLEAVGHLTGGVAHDFNNLLTVILGNAEMMTEQSSDPHLRPMAEMTLTAARRGAELTSRLLAFARRQPLDPKPTPFRG
ncbi:MAG: PAS domain S-box protein [Pseudohongiellaceae bacterium]